LYSPVARRSRSLCIALACALTVGLNPLSIQAQVGSPAGPVPPRLLEARRSALLDALDGSMAVIGSQRLKSIDGDYPQDSDFRQDNNFFYLTGLEMPGGWLVLNGAGEGSTTLFLPPRNARTEAWTGPQMGPGPEAQRASGIRDVRSSARFLGDVRSWAESRGSRSGPVLDQVVVWPGHPGHQALLDEAFRDLPGETGDACPLVAALRLVKDEDEIDRIRRAVEITSEGQREAWRIAEPGITEFELEATIEYVFRSGGAERLGFPCIVGSGPNSVILHYDKSRRTTEDGDLVVMDLGAEFGYYSADITRTIPVSGRFTSRQREVYELVLGTLYAVIDSVRPGATLADLTRFGRAYMEEHSGDLCAPGSCARYFIHGISHWLGMDVHDVGAYRALLEPGMVLTIEPGIYIPEEELGIRIEDDVLVTERGSEVISLALARDPDQVEAIMREAPRWVVRRR
jgi:Xaa-Pro aminopeptidase